MPAAVSSGRSDLASILADEAGQARIVDAFHRLDRGRPALPGDRVVGRPPDADHLDCVARPDGGDGVSGIDRPFEGVIVDYGDDIGNLRHIEPPPPPRGRKFFPVVV